MRLIPIITLFASCNSSSAPAAAPSTTPASPPNILLIVADDLGWADLNCYGNPLVKSPNLDALARRGVQFMQAYAAAPAGKPSRAALQTGLHPSRTDHGALPGNYETLGELAQRAGLLTAHIGKWQLGTGSKSPRNQGYDHVFAANESYPDSYYHPFFSTQPQADLLAETKPGDYLTDKLTDHALDLLDKWRDSTWLLSLNYYAPHVPLEGRKDQVTGYRALIDSTHWRKFPTLEYAAMISVIDENVGRIVDLLRENGQLENTLIIFTSDNGGLDLPAEGKLLPHTPPTDNGILRGGKGTLYEGGIRVPFIVHYPAYATTQFASLEQVMGTDIFPSVGEALSQGDYAASPDGQSFLHLLRGASAKPRFLFWSAPYGGPEGAASAVRYGDFKLYRDDSTDSLTYFNLGALPDESLRMALPPEGTDLLKALNARD
ncbi:sulfatase-like hydrolase/transferase [Neolewinella aurantiaca]|uniref:sulfatase-like hydrolase/transferase n=1 Tax=Neolewinella aurantiaca TaxID=2602767 RepID=UPI001C9CCA31|nr:sulfatase-like hydrolase/transferase [Neolewinella aurantiaca]